MSKILIIDDEKELVSLLQDELEARGHQVLTAYNGVDGVTLSKKQPGDVNKSAVSKPPKLI